MKVHRGNSHGTYSSLEFNKERLALQTGILENVRETHWECTGNKLVKMTTATQRTRPSKKMNLRISQLSRSVRCAEFGLRICSVKICNATKQLVYVNQHILFNKIFRKGRIATNWKACRDIAHHPFPHGHTWIHVRPRLKQYSIKNIKKYWYCSPLSSFKHWMIHKIYQRSR